MSGRSRGPGYGSSFARTLIVVMINVVEITDDNAPSVLALRLAPGQERFVTSLADSLEEAAENLHGNPSCRAVYADGQPVGFVMLSWDVEPQTPEINGPWFLCKLLIDHRQQGKGYSREVVQQIVELVPGHGATELLTSRVPGEGGPAGFSAKLGFAPTGDLDPDGEIILRLDLRR
jgi:GNAT superfamily N-acetyltransferase